jgi:hypothetical protein
MKLFGNRKLIGFILTGILLLAGMAVVKGLKIPEGVYFQFVGGVVGAYGAFVTANVVKEKKSNNGGEQ